MNPNINSYIVQDNPNTPLLLYHIYLTDAFKGGDTLNYIIREELQKWFSKSDLKKELMASVWHPRNIHRFKYLDPETFGGMGEEESEW
jgi:hypothetical protein